MIVKLTPILRAKLLILQIILIILSPIWILAVAHYLIYPLPYLFSSPSVVPRD
jgi:hypothetical protein